MPSARTCPPFKRTARDHRRTCDAGHHGHRRKQISKDSLDCSRQVAEQQGIGGCSTFRDWLPVVNLAGLTDGNHPERASFPIPNVVRSKLDRVFTPAQACLNAGENPIKCRTNLGIGRDLQVVLMKVAESGRFALSSTTWISPRFSSCSTACAEHHGNLRRSWMAAVP
jgi:hypothetical protein